MLTFIYRFLLRLPRFRGKSKIENVFRRRYLTPTLSELKHDLVMELDHLEWTQITLLRDGVIEPMTTALFGRILGTGDTYVDVGAHVGFHTLIARRHVGETGRVIAIEPQPYCCSKIMTNWRVNGFENLFLYPAAAGDRNDTVVLHNQSPTDKARLSLCMSPVNDEQQVFQVPLVRLDKIFEEQDVKRVKLLKVDTEAYEPEVLRGLGRFTTAVDNIILEMLEFSSEAAAKSMHLIEGLENLGYQLRTVDGRPWSIGQPITENNLWASRLHGTRL